MSKTKIEWATHTSNWIAGCTKVSPACKHCYAETMTARLATMPNGPARYRDGVVEDRRWTGRVSYDADALKRTFEGLRSARKPRRVFINSMSDTFHADVPPESLDDLAREINQLDVELARQERVPHSILLLTKRPERLLEWQLEHFPLGLPHWVWVGVTAENQEQADKRIPVLCEVAADVRFISAEPLLGHIEMEPLWTARIGWVIVGGESGPRARPTNPTWVDSLKARCQSASIPFFFKQWGEWVCLDSEVLLVGKKAAGAMLDGCEWREVPSV